MKKTLNIFAKSAMIAATALVAVPAVNAAEVEGWGEFKLYLDPGHAGRENRGLWDYSEAEKTLRVALNIRDMLQTYTDMPEECIKLCRETDNDQISLEERSDEANAWGADFYYSIHSDASASVNTIVTLFGGWTVDGVNVEKTPNGGKAYGEFLEPNLKSVMRVGSRGNRYDRDFYMPTTGTHENQYPYLSVNRRSNMPSLLSEGGYHTLAEQQQRNLNDDYKRLEAFAAFQSILQYRGLQLPAQNFITGMVYNSENNQPINGATITVSAPSDATFEPRTYTTDTYESLFCKYTKNPDLIHNGFYMFENLPAETDLELKFEAPGFDTVTKTIKVNTGGATSSDYISFEDIALTSNMPAIVAGVSVSDITSVESFYPLVLTFSRNMDRESVEQAFSINNDGEVTLSWENDYTLKIDISKLLPLWDYTIRIDGSIAKNKQTGAYLDGDADGVAGGDYVLTITMAEPDEEAPYVVATYPESEGEAIYSMRPPIRLQFNEMIDWNEDTYSDWFEVKDSTGKIYKIGHVSHSIINNASVLHCYLNEDLQADVAVLVTLKPVKDLSGNVNDGEAFRFLSEYRPMTAITEIRPMSELGTFWQPNGSGSSSGLCDEGNEITLIGESPVHGINSSFAITYAFDPNTTATSWFIRNHDPKGNEVTIRGNEGVLTMWVFGDGSKNETGLLIRDAPTNHLIMKAEPLTVDFIGWNMFSWDIKNDELKNFTGEGGTYFARQWYLDAIYIQHFDAECDPEEEDYIRPEGQIAYSQLNLTTWDNSAERKAKITDIELPENGIENIIAGATDEAPVYYNLNGIRVNGQLNPGIYVKIAGGKASKVIVK
ncbi:MAG: N-acetylmuramoyl-L-alanine amidase [Muribaculaceae bacterium]|nr:N-acetylmuramoyl-L-alanine amidase [Muribaculaceae bacterium]MDE6573808.1 N-acetylmuramoyl-L-alanine amidase [Muribaculaceae bacterium]